MTDDSTADDVDDAAAESRANAASPETVAQLAREYEQAGRSFARVTVVRREPPVSANVGDRAIVTPDDDIVGWIGGVACAQSVAVKEARAALADGEPRLVGLAPDPADVDRPGLASYPMTCHSGGTLELFVEPVTPAPRLVVVGDSPIAAALRSLAAGLTYDVVAVTDGTDPDAADDAVAVTDADAVRTALASAEYVVVASMGEFDELGVEGALAGDVRYVGLVASDERREQIAEDVAGTLGIDSAAVVDAVTTPAGLDIGAKTPEEIALSILAELVAVRRGEAESVAVDAADPDAVEVAAGGDDDESDAHDHHGDDHEHDAHDHHGDDHEHDAHDHHDHGDTDDETVVDPVCGMDVTVADAAASVDHDGTTYHFCGQGCADAFADAPAEYLEVVGDG